jgi:hypothetical protein
VTTFERFSTQFALTAMLMIVLLAVSVSSSASATVSRFMANGPFTDAFPSCNASGVCAELSVFSGGTSNAPQISIFYVLFLPDGSLFLGSGTIPSENVTNINSKTLTLAPTNTSTIAGFTNIFCDVNGNCTNALGGIVSGTWNQIKIFSSHSTFSIDTHFGPVLMSSHGTSDDFSATDQFSVLGISFQGFGDIGTQHSSQMTITVP